MVRIDVPRNEMSQLLHRKKVRICAAVVSEPRLDAGPPALLQIVLRQMVGRAGQDGVKGAEINGVEAVARGDHLLVKLFAGTDSDDPDLALGTDRFGKVEDPIAGDLGNEDLASKRILQRPKDHLHTFLE